MIEYFYIPVHDLPLVHVGDGLAHIPKIGADLCFCKLLVSYLIEQGASVRVF